MSSSKTINLVISISSSYVLDDRFWSKVDKTKSCWNWTAAISNKGYSHFSLNGKTKKAHRLSYEYFKGKIPERLQLDHLCRNRKCVNPDHLEAVTNQENQKRGIAALKQLLKTHCPRGHPYNEKNTYKGKEGWRKCRACHMVHQRKYRKKMKGDHYI